MLDSPGGASAACDLLPCIVGRVIPLGWPTTDMVSAAR